jgi:hypothetical protein
VTTVNTPVMTPEQQHAHDALVAYGSGRDQTYRMMLLVGYAGTGKSFTTGRVVESLLMPDSFLPLNIAVSAPTHKAVKVMKKMTEYAEAVEFATIHSLLGLKEEVDIKTGKIKFVRSGDPDAARIEEYDVILIDEVSMLSDELFALLTPYTLRGKKIIFIGDPAQIPPVNHKDSKPLMEDIQKQYNIGKVELTTIMRQAAGNPILVHATNIRQEYKTAADFKVETNVVTHDYGTRGVIRLNSGDEPAIKEVLKEYFDCPRFQSDADYMKVIAYRNVIVDEFNKQIRYLIYKQDHLPMLMVGEKLIMDEPLIIGRRIVLSKNEEIEVLGYDIKEGDFDYSTGEKQDFTYSMKADTIRLKFYDVQAQYSTLAGTKQVTLRILHESEGVRFKRVLDGIKAAALGVAMGSPLRGKFWQSFYRFGRLFSIVKYNYAITAHKSQGSTYDNALLVDWDMDVCCRFDPSTGIDIKLEERNRIKYVATTRAKELLFILK